MKTYFIEETINNNRGTKFTRTISYYEFFRGWLVIGRTTPWVSEDPYNVTMTRPFPR